jgi:hypothetical protein
VGAISVGFAAVSLWGFSLLQRVLVGVILLTAISLANAQAPSAPGKPLPPGPMQPKVKAACTQCHNATRITKQHLSRQQWSDQLDKMEGLGAVIAESDRKGMLDYLTRNFGPSKATARTQLKKSASTAN